MSDELREPPGRGGGRESHDLPDIWQKLQDFAARAKAEGWTPEQTREELARMAEEAPAADEADKPDGVKRGGNE